jgi:hypothetical protein
MATAASLGYGGVIQKHRPNDKEVADGHHTTTLTVFVAGD